MNGFEIVLDKVAVLSLLTLMGFISLKTKWLENDVKSGLQKIIFKLTLPLMIFTVISGFEYSGELLKNGLTVFILSYFFLGLQYFIGWLTGKVFKLSINKFQVHVLHTTFGNVVFLGYPLIHALFPDTPALFYAAVYHLAQMTIIWTFGIYTLNPDKSGNIFTNLKKLINPNTIAFAAGLLFMILGIKMPSVIHQAFSGIGNSTLYLSMLYIGMLVAGFKLDKKSLGFDVLVLNFNKLLIIPILVFIICKLIINYTGISLSFPAMGALVMQAAMPCMAILVILAKNYGADENSAMVNVFTTTIAGLLTLPLIFWMLLNWAN